MAEVKHISIDTSDEEALRIIEEDAAVIVDDVIPLTEIDKILEELEAKMRNFSKMYDFTHAIGGGVVQLLWDVEKDWLVANL